MSPEERDFVERYGLFFEITGLPRTAGRVHGWLLICDPPQRSLGDLATELGVTKAAVSTAIRRMEQAHYVERVPGPAAREHYYQVTGGGKNALKMIRDRMAVVTHGREIAELGLSVVGDQPTRRERLEEFVDLYRFMEKELGPEAIDRWQRYRAERQRERGEVEES